ncbi:hypothetical protein [Dickeya lacustris]|uniref:Uncharacterized protein n=1 Tax=Dickeya lacustris TaxID=2259638 RepID=A0ABY8G3P6_9GAMM|nr:hypothetical protein [Dickeya lacustris]WFN54539.1 hypothetical protein O1Q98_12750 [Dickeya lacustris]
MFTTSFWPAARAYHIHMVDIPLPDSLSPVALNLIHPVQIGGNHDPFSSGW